MKRLHISNSLNSLEGGYIGDYMGTTIGVIKGDTRSLDNGSYELQSKLLKGDFIGFRVSEQVRV